MVLHVATHGASLLLPLLPLLLPLLLFPPVLLLPLLPLLLPYRKYTTKTMNQRTTYKTHMKSIESQITHSETHRPIERQAFSAREGCFRQCALYGMAVFHTGGLFSGPFSAAKTDCFPDCFLYGMAVFHTGGLICSHFGATLPATERLFVVLPPVTAGSG